MKKRKISLVPTHLISCFTCQLQIFIKLNANSTSSRVYALDESVYRISFNLDTCMQTHTHTHTQRLFACKKTCSSYPNPLLQILKSHRLFLAKFFLCNLAPVVMFYYIFDKNSDVSASFCFHLVFYSKPNFSFQTFIFSPEISPRRLCVTFKSFILIILIFASVRIQYRFYYFFRLILLLKGDF